MTDILDGLLVSKGRVIMISGANRGIGLAIARRLYADGYSLSLGARRADALAKAVADLAPDRVQRCHFDARDHGTAAAWVAETADHYGRIDGLVNNAGVLHSHEIDDYNEERLEDAMDINLKAPYRLTAAAMPYLRRAGCGRVININSRSGLRYIPGSAEYCITKFAGIALTHGTRLEAWDDGVRATALCPGPTATDMAAHLPDQDKLTDPATIAAVASLLLAMPNNATVPIMAVCCDKEPGL